MSEEKKIETINDPLYFEKLLIKWLFIHTEMREKVRPFLSPSVFNSPNAKEVVKRCLQFEEKFGSFPSTQDMSIDLSSAPDAYNLLQECLSLKDEEYNHEHLVSRVEEFFRGSLAFNALVEAHTSLKENEWSDISAATDKLRDAASFTFNTSVGLEFLDPTVEEALFESLHDNTKAIPTGVPSFDALIDGGLHEKSLTLFIGQVNLGKTAAMIAMACNMLSMNKNVLYITLEMSREKISQRIMSNLFDADRDALRMLTRSAFHSVFEKTRARIKQRIIVEEFPTKTINCNRIRALLRELEQKKKFKPDVCFVDYLSIMLPNVVRKEENTYTEMMRISEEMRGVAVESIVPFVSAEQINREGFDAASIGLDNTANSIGTAATADIVVAMTQTEELRAQRRMVWTLLKNRYGINRTKTIVGFDTHKMRVFDVTAQTQAKDTQEAAQKGSIDAIAAAQQIIQSRKRREMRAVGLTLE